MKRPLMMQLALALASALIAGASWAAPTEALVSGVPFTIVEPEGYVALKNPDGGMYAATARVQAKGGNRLIAMMWPPTQARALDATATVPSIPLDRYAVVFLSQKFLDRAVPVEEFNAIRRELTSNAPVNAKMNEARVNEAVASLARRSGVDPARIAVKGGENVSLGSFSQDERHVTYAAIAMNTVVVDGKPKATATVFILAVIYTRARLVNLAVYRDFTGQADVDAAKATMSAWIPAFLKANP